MSNATPRSRRPAPRPDPHIRRAIAELKSLPSLACASPPDYADLACLLRAHREHAARVIDNQLIGDTRLARIHAKICRILEQQIEFPRYWAEAADDQRAFRRKMRRLG